MKENLIDGLKVVVVGLVIVFAILLFIQANKDLNTTTVRQHIKVIEVGYASHGDPDTLLTDEGYRLGIANKETTDNVSRLGEFSCDITIDLNKVKEDNKKIEAGKHLNPYNPSAKVTNCKVW